MDLSLTIYLEYKIAVLLCVDFIVFLPYNISLQEKFVSYTNLFCSNGNKKNDKITHKCFKEKLDKPWL